MGLEWANHTFTGWGRGGSCSGSIEAVGVKGSILINSNEIFDSCWRENGKSYTATFVDRFNSGYSSSAINLE